MKIEYGVPNHLIDVTDICTTLLTRNNVITIPQGDSSRGKYFTDPLIGVLKKVYVNGVEYDHLTRVEINTDGSIITYDEDFMNSNMNSKLNFIHSKLKLNYGVFTDELPEQRMVVRYLNGNEKVLEIGGNIGRNSLVIASITKHLVTLESNVAICSQLIENRYINNSDFQIECSALSNRKLIQKGWDTVPSDTLQPGFEWVNTVTFDELQSKYNIEFDTIVLDCEGAFYYILMDMPEILNNINLIIMENDYVDLSHKNYIDRILSNQFYVDYSESGGWGPCSGYFFEVWKRR
jgi:FkbM family methyltransferase